MQVVLHHWYVDIPFVEMEGKLIEVYKTSDLFQGFTRSEYQLETMLAFTVLILIISYIDTKIQRGEVDVLNGQKCPSERPVAGIPFRGGELNCYNEETIIEKGRLIDINQKKWITLHTYYYSMFKLEGGQWKMKSFRVRHGKRRYSLMIYPELGRLRLIKGLHHPVL